MKTTTVPMALILALVFLVAVLSGAAIMYKRLLSTETYVWEVRAVKAKDVAEVVLPPEWETMYYNKKTHTIYMRRRVENGEEWQAKQRCPQTIPRHKKSPRSTEV